MPQDYAKYLSILEDVRETYPFILHAYCLMPNHIHLQLETIQYPVGAIMKKLHTKYAIWYNKQYECDGHLFQGRFGAKLIEDQNYFLVVSHYIHLNPLKAEMVTHPEDYRWSSYLSYIFSIPNLYIDTTKTLSLFPNLDRELYQRFVESEEEFNSLMPL